MQSLWFGLNNKLLVAELQKHTLTPENRWAEQQNLRCTYTGRCFSDKRRRNRGIPCPSNVLNEAMIWTWSVTTYPSIHGPKWAPTQRQCDWSDGTNSGHQYLFRKNSRLNLTSLTKKPTTNFEITVPRNSTVHRRVPSNWVKRRKTWRWNMKTYTEVTGQKSRDNC